jgi:hypothetical protein
MCLGKNKQIGSSHLMPAGLYETCRSNTSEPIKVSDQIVMETSRQTQDYLLCVGKSSCEELLNREGEQWTLPMLMKKDRSFPLYALLQQSTLHVDEEDVKTYQASNIPGINVEKLAHFAMGIFWKASVHSWKKEKGDPRIKLGPYSEVIRRYLIGEANFPESVSLVVNVSAPARAPLLFTDPVSGQERGSHFVYVPGILFGIMVGGANTGDTIAMFREKHLSPDHGLGSSHGAVRGQIEAAVFQSAKVPEIHGREKAAGRAKSAQDVIQRIGGATLCAERFFFLHSE